jgi:hypothetical protein
MPATKEETPFAALASRLKGPVLVRLSSGWWRAGHEWPDVLGIALRFQDEPGAPPSSEDQDLLLSTSPSLAEFPVAPLLTDVHDFLRNTYNGLLPFTVKGLGTVRIRLRPVTKPRRGAARRPSTHAGQTANRSQRLAAAVAQKAAVFLLELSHGNTWVPVVELKLVRARPDVDQAALCFSPFLTGRGVKPEGFIQGLRRGVYALSQAARPIS